jgi:putative endonuclease
LPALRKSQDKMLMASFVYVLAAKNSAGSVVPYVGWTLDLDRRLNEHNGGLKGARSTRGRTWGLVYAEKWRTRRAAMRREHALKADRAFRALLRQGLQP